MGGDSAVRSLLEKMTEYASAAYLRMLERFVIVHSIFPYWS
jgi:gamma-tubulin complex component 2